MRDIIINSQEEADKLCDEYGNLIVEGQLTVGQFWLQIKGSIEAGDSIEAEGSIEAGWFIKAEGYIKAEWFIEAEGYINARGYIEAGWFIKVGGFIEVGGYIKAGESINARGYIKAGEYIKAGWYVFSAYFDIVAKSLTTTRLPFWRKYYAEMPPLKKYKKAILDENNCWEQLRKMISKEEAKKICKWDGWHWIIRVQLEMFFGLKTEYEFPRVN